MDRGKVRFERRPSRSPDMTLSWPEAADFFASIQEGRTPDGALAMEGNVVFRTYVDLVYKSFCRSLEQVIKYPVDDAGNPLM